MNPIHHFAFADFARALENLENTFRNEADRYLLWVRLFYGDIKSI